MEGRNSSTCSPKDPRLGKNINPRMSPPDPQYGAALFYLLCILNIYLFVVIVVQSLSRICLFATPWTAALQVSLSFTISQSFLKLMFIESVMPSNRLTSVIPFSSHLQSFPASGAFPVSHFFASAGQSIRASASVIPMKTQD